MEYNDTKIDMGDPSYDVITHIDKLMEGKQFLKVINILEDPSNSELIKESAFDIIPSVSSKLQVHANVEDASDFDVYENIFFILAKRGNPKEVLLSLVEQADRFKKKEFFFVYLNPLKEVLLRVPGRRGKSFEEILTILNTHILKLPQPENYNLEGDERLLLDVDPAVQISSFVLPKYMEFFLPFVDEVSIRKTEGENVCYLDRIERQRELLAVFLLKLFGYPLLYHDLHHDPNRAKSTIRVCTEKIVLYISSMYSNVFNLYPLSSLVEHDFVFRKSDCSSESCLKPFQKVNETLENESVSQIALATFVYVVFAEQLAPDSRPYVYSHTCLFEKHVYYLIKLLSESQNLVIYKGLSLSKFFLRNLMNCELPCKYLELQKFEIFPKMLASVAVYCPVQDYRILAIKLFEEYIAKYDWEGRYRLLLLIISSFDHSGVQGFVINLYKNNLHSCLNQKSCLNSYFCGKNLHYFLRFALKLPEDVETDLLECSERILGALNLLRYLVLRDNCTENITGIWDTMNDVNETFLKPVRNGLVLSKAHYKLKMQLIIEEGAGKDKIVDNMVVNGQALPNLLEGEQVHVIESALLKFDVIESILMRLNEVL